MSLKNALILCGLCACVCHAAAAPLAGVSPEGGRAYHLDNEFWTRLAKDAGGVMASPFSWRTPQFLACAAVLGTAALAYANDERIRDWALSSRTPESKEVMAVLEKGGDAAYLTAVLAGLYAAGEIAPSRGLRKTAVLGLESLAVSGAIVLSLKCLLGRARPDQGLPSNHFEPFTVQAAFMSLPSGHASSVFAVATTLARRTDSLAADALIYAFAAAVAVSRVHDDKHWASDVILGAALGHVVASKIADLNDEEKNRIRVSAVLSPVSFGVAIRF